MLKNISIISVIFAILVSFASLNADDTKCSAKMWCDGVPWHKLWPDTSCEDISTQGDVDCHGYYEYDGGGKGEEALWVIAECDDGDKIYPHNCDEARK